MLWRCYAFLLQHLGEQGVCLYCCLQAFSCLYLREVPLSVFSDVYPSICYGFPTVGMWLYIVNSCLVVHWDTYSHNPTPPNCNPWWPHLLVDGICGYQSIMITVCLSKRKVFGCRMYQTGKIPWSLWKNTDHSVWNWLWPLSYNIGKEVARGWWCSSLSAGL